MTAPTMELPEIPSPQEIARMFVWLNQQLRAAAATARDADEKAAKARVAFIKAKASAFIHASGAMDLRKAIADEESADVLLTAELADVEARAARERIKVLRDQLESTRSLNAVLRAEMGLAGVMGP
ncbi:hypothetical protein [Glutamicibacter sp. V16R2B1]|uniref:hypothetical protein n=1 Tax=Glutamicibacter sp. V16R2B1 TaxID=2036207 RepID=UPI0010FDF186|nr:hypothetical protein [Glutamicibacter sp. V16R2B1]MCK9901225.1 hypothetical protein [Frankia sp. Cpl3]TLK46596.1 hypothetical protein FDN03_16185 [Glutamicibacter sp. V16R2B1]